MFFCTALFFWSVLACDVVCNASGYVFETTDTGWHCTDGKVERKEPYFCTIRDLAIGQSTHELYELKILSEEECPIEQWSKLLSEVPMPNLAYVDMSGVKNVDALCIGLSSNKTLRNLRMVNLDRSDVTEAGVKAIMDMKPSDFPLIRDMKAISSRYGCSVAQILISLRNMDEEKSRQFKTFDGTVSEEEWPVSYLCNATPNVGHLFFKIIT